VWADVVFSVITLRRAPVVLALVDGSRLRPDVGGGARAGRTGAARTGGGRLGLVGACARTRGAAARGGARCGPRAAGVGCTAGPRGFA
jgi:hypothetical protein